MKVDKKEECEKLKVEIEVTENNHDRAQERYHKAAAKFNAAEKALNDKENECKQKHKEFLINAGAGAGVGGITGGPVAASREVAAAIAAKAEEIYQACIADDAERNAYEQAKEELKSAEFWKKAYEDELAGYREECKQLGCDE